jgi:hypothetical protein
MPEGIVISLEIFGLVQEMGNRGSKSVSFITVKEQRADGSSIFSKYCKVCSKCQGNLVFMLCNLEELLILIFIQIILKDLFFLVKLQHLIIQL